jgi:hypothetical protein
MAAAITEKEWNTLTPETFDTMGLLHAVDAIDELRADLNDGDGGAPPQLRTDLLHLHQKAMAVFNEGSRSQVAELFELAGELEDQVSTMTTLLERVEETLAGLTKLYPDSLIR